MPCSTWAPVDKEKIENSLRNQAYSNILKILPPKNENFQIKILIFFIFLLKNIDCGYSLANEYPQPMFLSRNKKIMHTPVTCFTIKVGFEGGGQTYIGMFL